MFSRYAFCTARDHTSFRCVLGYHQKYGHDRLDADVRRKVLHADNAPPSVYAVDVLEAAIKIMAAEEEKDKKDKPTVQLTENECLGFLRVLSCFLTVHHVIQHVTVYSELRKAQADLLLNPAVLVSTTTAALKLNAGASPWSKNLCSVGRCMILPDEIQTLGDLEVAGVADLP